MKGGKLKVTTVRLPDDVHRYASLAASRDGRSLTGYIVALIKKEMRNDTDSRKIDMEP